MFTFTHFCRYLSLNWRGHILETQQLERVQGAWQVSLFGTGD